mgnify:CR=1 FL=1
MPRGIKKQINYSEELSKIEARIIHHQNSIKELKEKREELLQQKDKEEIVSLKNYLTQNHLTTQDLIALVENQLIPKIS